MVDKPKGRAEQLLERFFRWCRMQQDELKDVFTPVCALLKEKKTAHPILAKTTITASCLLICGLIVVGFATPKTVHVVVDDSLGEVTTTFETTAMRVDSFLEEHNIDYVSEQDVIDVELHDGIDDEMNIHITKAFPVSVTADGETHTLITLPTTVREVLAELCIMPGENDILSVGMDDPVYKDEEIILQRVRTEYETERVETKFEVKYVADSSLVIGETKVEQKGRKGVKEETYEITYVDGKEVERTLYQTETVKKRRDKLIHYGTKLLSGRPSGLKYKEKISRVRAVSYHYGGNPRGSYGLSCEYGTCAVDPDLIPLGSLLYIEGYGYAIANDVGGAIKGKTVDVYMERMEQCGIWGARWCDVYIVRRGA